MKASFRLAAVFLLSISLLACTSSRAISPITAASASAKLQPGDKVDIVTRGDKHYRFEIVKLDAGAISGPSQTIPYEDIRRLEIIEFSGQKTLGLGAALAVAYVALIALIGHTVGHGIEDALQGR